MAGGIKGITVKIGGDTTELGKALKDAQSQSNKLQKELKDVDKALKLDPSNITLLRQKEELLKEAIESAREKQIALNRTMQEVDSGRVKMTAEEHRNLEREIEKNKTDIKNLTKEYEELGSKAGINLDKVGDGFIKIGQSAEKAGKKLLPVTGAITGIGVGAVKTTADFDKAMSQVQAISGATGEEFDALRDKALEMGSKTKFSASESAEALNYMAMAGWKSEDMLNGIEGIMSLAAASNTELATASDIVTDALTAFGRPAEDAGRLADIMASTAANANTNVEMMGESFKYVAPLAGAMGYSMEDVAIALGEMANAGIKGSQAGTALRTLLTNMANPSDKMANAMNALGVSLDDGAGNMKSLREIMVDLKNGFGDLKMSEDDFATAMELLDQQLADGTISESKFQKAQEELMTNAYGAEGALMAQNAAMLAGKTGLSGLMAIVNASNEDFDKLSMAIDDSTGSAQEMADVMMNNLSGQGTVLKSTLEGLAIQFGDILTPYISGLAAGIQGVLVKFSQLDESSKKNIIVIGALVASLGPLLIMIGKLSTGVGALMKILPRINPALGAIKTSILGISAPVGIVVAALAGLAAVFVTLWNTNEEFRTKITEIWNEVVANIQNFVAQIQERIQPLTDIFSVVLGALWELWKGLCDLLAPTFTGAFQIISDTLGTIFDVIIGLLDVFIGIFTGDWSKLWDGVKEIVSTVGEFIGKTLGTVFKWFEDTCLKVLTAIKDLFGFIGDLLSGAWEIISGTFTEAGKTIGNFASGAWNSIKNAFSGMAKWFGDQITAVKSIFSGIGKWFGDLFSGAWETIKSKFNKWASFWGGLWDTIKNKFATIGNVIGSAIGDAIKSGLNRVLEFFENRLNDAVDILNGAIGAINKIPGVEIDKFERIKLPRLATGTVVDRPTEAIIGEDGPEAVIPLKNNTEWINNVARSLADIQSRSMADDRVIAALDNIYRRLDSLQVVLDSGQLIGGIVDPLDGALGERVKRIARGW